MPKPAERKRSRSPRRDTHRPRRKEGGFKWKEKRQDDDGEQSRDGDRPLERGYKEQYRARSPRPTRDADDHDQESREDPELPKQEKKERKEKKEKKAAAVPVSGEAMIIVNVNNRLGTKAAIPCYASDPISKHGSFNISLNPANGSTELFKAQVAARIGLEPHEILLKRQGERPFKDQLTLEDYGVSNGVQLDLSVTHDGMFTSSTTLTMLREVDTGD